MAIGLVEIMNVIGGLVLCAGIVGALPGIGKYLEKAGKWLGSFQVLIGIITLIVGLLNLGSLQGIIATLVGIILLTGVFYMIPVLGKYLTKFGKWLGGFQTTSSERRTFNECSNPFQDHLLNMPRPASNVGRPRLVYVHQVSL